MEPYDLEEYIPLEYWTDEKKAVALVNRLSRILKREGFPVLYDRIEDTTCLWQHHIFQSIAEENKKRKGWWEPEYHRAVRGDGVGAGRVQRGNTEDSGSGEAACGWPSHRDFGQLCQGRTTETTAMIHGVWI